MLICESPQVVSAAHDQVTIGWDDPGDASVTGYRILRRLRDSYEVGRFDVIEDNTDGGNSDGVIPDETIGRIDIRDPDKLAGRDPLLARSIVTVDPPPLQTSTQTVDDRDRTHYPDLDLHSDNSDPRSLWSDGVTLWVGEDSSPAKVFAYELSGTFGDRVSAKDIANITTEAFYVTGFGDRLWVGDEAAPTLSSDPSAYAFGLPGLARSSGHDVVLRSGSGANTVGVVSIRGLATDGNYLWVSDSGTGLGAGDTVHAFRLFDDPATLNVDEYGTLDVDRGLGFGDFTANGIFTDGETMWGVEVGSSTARAVSLANGERVEALEFDLHPDNDNPRGIWSNGVTMFVVDETDAKIYTYRVGVVKASGVPAPGMAHVSAGGFHSCALLDNGAVRCWGNNSYGQAPTDRVHSDTTLEYVSVDAGVWHTCAVVDDGSLDCWGRNDDAHLDSPALEGSLEWAQVSAGGYLGGVRTDAESSHSRTCGLVIDGTIRCWGDTSLDLAAVPAAGVGLHYRSVSAGGAHVCATRSDGELVCWGNRAWFDDSGKAHHHPQRDTYNAPRLAQPDNARFASAGYWHTCWTYGTETAPKVICTGDNSLKQARWKKKSLA